MTTEGATKVKVSAELVGLVPEGVTTVTLTGPAGSAGEFTVREVPAPFTTTPVPGTDPKLTAVSPVKLLPVTVPEVPPAVVPVVGLTPVTTGPGGATKVKVSAELVGLVPEGVTTVTLTGPADSAGEFTVREVPAPFTTTPVPGTDPKLTAVSPVKLLPVTVTEVPPAVVPVVGLTPVTTGPGGATKVKVSAELVGLVPE